MSVRKLDATQRAVFDVIMHRRRWNAETRDEALGIIERATERDTLLEEVVFWTDPRNEPPHKRSSVALAMEMGEA